MKRLLLSASPEDYWEQEPAVTIGELVLFPVLRPKGTLAMSLHSASFCGGQGLKQELLSWCTDKFCCPPALTVRFGSCAAGHWGSPVQEELLGTSFLAHFSKAVGKGVWLCCSWDHLLACHCTWHKERLTRMLFLAHKETPPLVWRHFFKQSPLKWGGTREWLQHVWHFDLSPSEVGRSCFPENMVLSESSDPSPARLTMNSRASPSGEDACMWDEVSQGQPEETFSRMWSGIQKINHSGTGLQCQRCFVPGWKTPRTGQAYGDCAHLPLSFS